MTVHRTYRGQLRRHETLPAILVAQLHGRTGTARQDLDVGTVRVRSKGEAGPVLGGFDLHMRPTARVPQAKQYCFGVAGGTIRHLSAGIWREHGDTGADLSALIDDFERAATEHGHDVLVRGTRSGKG